MAGGSKRKVRYAVAGLGYIAQAAVLPAFRHAKDKAELTALISSDPEKLSKLGKKYEVENLYSAEEYEKCLRSGEVDAVYIALPNNQHCQYTEIAARAGIHVLCEKPMAVTSEECQQMIHVCEANGVKLMIAYRLHFEEANLRAVELARKKELGELRFFSSTFSINVQHINNIRLKAKLGGGPLFDLGIYCINAARHLFQEEPTEVVAFAGAKDDPRFDEVEEAVTACLRFPNEKLAQFVCSFGASDTAVYELVGDKGSLRVENAYEYATPIEHFLKVGDEKSHTKFKKTDQFAPELNYFAECILKGKPVEPSGREGLADIAIIEALYESVREGRVVGVKRLDQIEKKKVRPTLKLLRQSPPITMPDLVHAASPSEG